MTTKQLFLILLCLLFLSGTGYSQMNTTTDTHVAAVAVTRKESTRAIYWNTTNCATSAYFVHGLCNDPEFRTALGVSEKYYQEILASERIAKGSLSDIPEYQEAMRELIEANEAVVGVGRAMMQMEIPPDADEKALKRIQRAEEGVKAISQEFSDEARRRGNEALDNALTPELNQKLREATLAIAVSAGMPQSLPGAFAVLDLTDAQREQMERIKKELEPEFEKFLDICDESDLVILARTGDAFDKSERAVTDAGLQNEARQKAYEEIGRRILMEDSEYQRAREKSNSSARSFVGQFTTRMKEILTDEQRKRLQALTDNPPEYVRLHIQRLRENRGEKNIIMADEEGGSKRVADGTDMRLPGPDSWQPGDPLPEGDGQPRNTGSFPRPAE